MNDHFDAGQLGYGAAGTAILVEALLDRGTEDDLAEAQSAIDRVARLPADEGLVLRDIWLLRLRALLARARGDDARSTSGNPDSANAIWYRYGRTCLPAAVATKASKDMQPPVE